MTPRVTDIQVTVNRREDGRLEIKAPGQHVILEPDVNGATLDIRLTWDA